MQRQHPRRAVEHGRGAGERGGIDVEQRDAMVVGQEPSADGQPDAPRAAGDDRHRTR